MDRDPDSAYHQALVRAFRIASATGERARSVHLLAALGATVSMASSMSSLVAN